MEKHLTALEAWNDFWAWIRHQEKWRDISRREKQYLYKAQKAARDGVLGYDRVKRLLTTYAHGRYQFSEIIYLLEK